MIFTIDLIFWLNQFFWVINVLFGLIIKGMFVFVQMKGSKILGIGEMGLLMKRLV